MPFTFDDLLRRGTSYKIGGVPVAVVPRYFCSQFGQKSFDGFDPEKLFVHWMFVWAAKVSGHPHIYLEIASLLDA